MKIAKIRRRLPLLCRILGAPLIRAPPPQKTSAFATVPSLPLTNPDGAETKDATSTGYDKRRVTFYNAVAVLFVAYLATGKLRIWIWN